jgi:hypothetical protein
LLREGIEVTAQGADTKPAPRGGVAKVLVHGVFTLQRLGLKESTATYAEFLTAKTQEMWSWERAFPRPGGIIRRST